MKKRRLPKDLGQFRFEAEELQLDSEGKQITLNFRRQDPFYAIAIQADRTLRLDSNCFEREASYLWAHIEPLMSRS